MRSISVLIVIACMFLSCEKEVNYPVTDCLIDSAQFNEDHPLGNALQLVLDRYCEQGLPGLSLAVETLADGLWTGAAGMSRLEDHMAMQPCHVHHSASIAKSYISTLAFKMAEEGNLDLDQSAQSYLPDEIVTNIANLSDVTIRQLLNHSSGIFNFDDNMKVYVDTFNDPIVNPSSQVLFEKYVYGMPAYFAPGAGFRYSNTNYSLMGMILEAAGGRPLGELMNEHIIEALNLTATYYKSSTGYPNVPALVNSYFEHYPGQLQNCTDIQTHFSEISQGHEGLLATAYDYARFMKELVSGSIISSESFKEMIVSRDGENYGHGIMRYETDYETGYGHTGGSIGTMTYAIYFPDSGISFSICCNLGTVFASDNTRMFYDDLFQELIEVIFSAQAA